MNNFVDPSTLKFWIGLALNILDDTATIDKINELNCLNYKRVLVKHPSPLSLSWLCYDLDVGNIEINCSTFSERIMAWFLIDENENIWFYENTNNTNQKINTIQINKDKTTLCL